jgi:cysteine desulfurase
VVTSPLEHPAVRGAVRALEEGWGPAGAGAGRVTLVPVSARGEIVPADLEAVLRDDTGLVTLALANHELGNVYPMAALGRAARRRGALVHTDAVQAAGKVRLDMVSMEADAATISAHKIGGPKGVGAVFVRKELDLPPLWQGGHQERERRPGTENLTGIVGFGVACRSAGAALDGERERLSALRDALERGLLEVPGARILGITEVGGRLPGTTCVAFAGAPGQLVAIGLDLEGICVSTGAACTSGAIRPSPVLEALGQAPAEAGEALRLSLGWTTTAADVARVCAVVPRVVARVRAAQALPAATAAAHAGGAA